MTATLIARLAVATGPDRELDDIIHFDILGHKRSTPFCEHCKQATVAWAPTYTASLDAAIPGENITQVRLLTYGHPDGDKWEAVQYPGGRKLTARGNTEALARRIAALRARGIP